VDPQETVTIMTEDTSLRENIDQIREHVQRDKRIAGEVIEEARETLIWQRYVLFERLPRFRRLR